MYSTCDYIHATTRSSPRHCAGEHVAFLGKTIISPDPPSWNPYVRRVLKLESCETGTCDGLACYFRTGVAELERGVGWGGGGERNVQ